MWREEMGMERMRELAAIVKEAAQRSAGVAKALCFLHVTGRYLCSPNLLIGPSMLPTFNDYNIVLAESISPRQGRLGPGDVVILRSPEDPTKSITKRIKAVAGDVVSYAPDPTNAHLNSTILVPKGHVWVEGDNMHNSRDSRQFGAVPYAQLQCRVFLVIWPPKDCRFIGNKIV